VSEEDDNRRGVSGFASIQTFAEYFACCGPEKAI